MRPFIHKLFQMSPLFPFHDERVQPRGVQLLPLDLPERPLAVGWPHVPQAGEHLPRDRHQRGRRRVQHGHPVHEEHADGLQAGLHAEQFTAGLLRSAFPDDARCRADVLAEVPGGAAPARSSQSGAHPDVDGVREPLPAAEPEAVPQPRDGREVVDVVDNEDTRDGEEPRPRVGYVLQRDVLREGGGPEVLEANHVLLGDELEVKVFFGVFGEQEAVARERATLRFATDDW